jgi:hypothetical protein
VQFHLQVVDEQGRECGLLMPRCRLDSGRVEKLLLTVGRYITAPGSGNFYARWFLEKIVPVPTEEWPQSFDNYAATYAGFYGVIGAVQRPLGFYRVHRNNMTRFAPEGKREIDIAQLDRLMSRGIRLRTLIERIARELNLRVAPDIVTSHWMYLKLELARLKLLPQTRYPELLDSASRMLSSAATSPEQAANGLDPWNACSAQARRHASHPNGVRPGARWIACARAPPPLSSNEHLRQRPFQSP